MAQRAHSDSHAGLFHGPGERSAAELAHLRWRRSLLAAISIVALLLIGYVSWQLTRDDPVVYREIDAHFKYGSIGSEPGGRLTATVGGLLPPEKVFRVLPAICPERAPGGYADFGLLYEPDRTLPIGVSQRHRVGVDQVGANCALCHTGTYRESEAGPRHVVLGMPANNLQIQRLFRFVTDCTLDERFTPDNVVGRIEEGQGRLSTFQRALYRYQVVPRVRAASVDVQASVGALIDVHAASNWGHGRVDTFNPYKATQFNWRLSRLPPSELIGPADYPSLWNQGPRDGMHLHWDGNNTSLDERNLSAALGAGVTPVTVDHPSIRRVRNWTWDLKPPVYPFSIDRNLARTGEAVYAQHCRNCHADHRFRDGVSVGRELGQVLPIQDIQSDPGRLNSYTLDFAVNQYTLYPDSKYRFKHFRKTNGYANQPLDGIWLRAPYLHNGSVPSMRDLLEPAERRPKTFYKGNDVFDQKRLGFVSNIEHARGQQFEHFDTQRPGNGNQGHEYGTQLSAAEKDAVVEYMKTF